MAKGDHIPLTESIYYILLSLNTPRHGYAIMQHIQEISHGRIHMGPGTLYGAIKSLLNKGWIKPIPSVGDSRKKQYGLTDEGRIVIRDELDRLEELVDHGKKMIGGTADDV